MDLVTDDTGRTPADGAFVVDFAGFNGPLDLLLALLRDEQVDIYDIPVARVCEQFLARMHELKLNEAAEYLEMAARLIRIKAQMLLPRKDGAARALAVRPARGGRPRAARLAQADHS